MRDIVRYPITDDEIRIYLSNLREKEFEKAVHGEAEFGDITILILDEIGSRLGMNPDDDKRSAT